MIGRVICIGFAAFLWFFVYMIYEMTINKPWKDLIPVGIIDYGMFAFMLFIAIVGTIFLAFTPLSRKRQEN